MTTSGADGDLGQVLVIIPTYNERDNIEPILARLAASVPDAHALIVDDGKPRRHRQDRRRDSRPPIRASTCMHRTTKTGLGGAYIAGFGWGLEHGYDVLVEMDADGSHAPEQLPRLLDALRRADVVLGSRWVPGGTVVNWPKSRELISRGGNLYTRLALGINLRDATGGYRAYRRSVLEAIDYRAVVSEGYCFQVDLAWRAARGRASGSSRCRSRSPNRERGESKMSGSIVREALWRVTQWGVRHRADQLKRVVSVSERPAT